jgi:hypothetical protein
MCTSTAARPAQTNAPAEALSPDKKQDGSYLLNLARYPGGRGCQEIDWSGQKALQ